MVIEGLMRRGGRSMIHRGDDGGWVLVMTIVDVELVSIQVAVQPLSHSILSERRASAGKRGKVCDMFASEGMVGRSKSDKYVEMIVLPSDRVISVGVYVICLFTDVTTTST
mmetsp:Transcript_13524/g.15936  ORF Transcript_13524/g.15936 Transcript_13524/m.15936 type:complete len:111 (+) Transcript_13524:1375-1707(+)|eukprot:CAMPEP_0198271106 /NCGR_PEP_ID=MMETSP1447-20131203/47829_1 /TAXON_ID=420782 /ORGANISM="Chaetoceros dichaeta, Strain CCMP1751" /LENGTH=110 /DNA_ID=CAMNT_0043963509 /DNA_START=1284 /DNA_END=1616 /DNA_ORIENTATION=-